MKNQRKTQMGWGEKKLEKENKNEDTHEEKKETHKLEGGKSLEKQNKHLKRTICEEWLVYAI